MAPVVPGVMFARAVSLGLLVTPVATGGSPAKGLCAIDVTKVKVINSGALEERTQMHAAGRVGGPAWLIRSLDGGETWQTLDLNHELAMFTDVKFFSPSAGFVVGGSNADVEESHAVILKTIAQATSSARCTLL